MERWTGGAVMRKVLLFQSLSLDGYFEAPGHDLSWAGGDYDAFSSPGSSQVDSMLFGHRTYEMMKAFWPTQRAREVAPAVADFMNKRTKYVASHHAFDPGWSNVQVLSGDDVPAQVRKLKEGPGGDIIIFGSNELCVSLLQEGLLDELQILLRPVVLGQGTALFAGLTGKVDFFLADTHQFKSGLVLIRYAPARQPDASKSADQVADREPQRVAG
jgi:dihydrofolate reductase